jgi:tetratricopeptide (TPR) repeat protein
MIRILFRILSEFPRWERPAQVGCVTAVVMLVVSVLFAALGPDNIRQPAIAAVMGLVIVAQIIVMWANRGMVTEYTIAQRHFRDGEFEMACTVLEEFHANDNADVLSLTLLGNAYRQLARLEEGEVVLLQALELDPKHYFPLYGLGRTLMAQGRYEEAASTIQSAIDNGAAGNINFDVGEAYYRLGDKQMAIELLQTASQHVQYEAHRALMTTYLLHVLGEGDFPSSELIQAGLPYWQVQAELFDDTEYGQALADDVKALSE